MSNEVTMDKTYTARNGRKARVLCTDFANAYYPVVAAVMRTDGTGEEINLYTREGLCYDSNNQHSRDLIEVPPFADFKLDEPVMVRMAGDADWTSRHFACANTSGTKAMCWCDGGTSWTAVNSAVWDECRRPTAEELAS